MEFTLFELFITSKQFFFLGSAGFCTVSILARSSFSNFFFHLFHFFHFLGYLKEVANTTTSHFVDTLLLSQLPISNTSKHNAR